MKKINDLEQLRVAKAELRAQVAFKEKEMSLLTKYASAYYSPANVFNMLFDKISPAFNLAGLAVELYDKVKAQLSRRKSSAADDEASDSAPDGDADASDGASDGGTAPDYAPESDPEGTADSTSEGAEDLA
ncbi:MAG: hypothetical protein MJY67_05230 [Bacteroidales bacterium]|nr:hypothetical protein [Bacteroidales bacterium]